MSSPPRPYRRAQHGKSGERMRLRDLASHRSPRGESSSDHRRQGSSSHRSPHGENSRDHRRQGSSWNKYFVAEYDPLRAGTSDGSIPPVPHDGAIKRAMKCDADKLPPRPERPDYTLFVARLNPVTSSRTLREAFEVRYHINHNNKPNRFEFEHESLIATRMLLIPSFPAAAQEFGTIESCEVVRDFVTGMSRCYGFIEFRHRADASLAYTRANSLELDGRRILVEKQVDLKGWVPRRLGGGLGGRKESGQLRFGGRDRPFIKPGVLISNPLRSAKARKKASGGLNKIHL